MKKLLVIVVSVLSACSALSQGNHVDSLLQNKNSLALDSLTSFFTHEDSLEIFDLIDSLLKLDPIAVRQTSQMAVRIGYNSNIVADNRTFNISQFGLAPGVSYYHKSGAYADVTGYWSKEYEPDYYLTVASAGYLHTFSRHYSILGEYSHYFYNLPKDSTVSVPYTNNVGLSNYFEFKPVVLRLDYYLYFGDKSAHRIMPSLGLNLVKRNWLGLNRVSFFPSIGVLFGSEEISKYEPYDNIFLRVIYNQSHAVKLPYFYVINHIAFGVMNYSFSAPISITKKDWTFLLSYTYNIPKSLPGEDLSLQNGGYLSFSITRYFSF